MATLYRTIQTWLTGSRHRKHGLMALRAATDPPKPKVAISLQSYDPTTLEEFLHEAHVLANKLAFPVVSTFEGREYAIPPWQPCPCSQCKDRNPELRRPEALPDV